jgi:hypothetical protein
MKNNVGFAPSNYGEEKRDSKFEGNSGLEAKKNKEKSQSRKNQSKNDAKAQQIEYIDILMKQIATMETEISLLKTREVDQKNQASGYETLLRDGIPLNEHFLSLKNKFNNEKDTLDKQCKNLKEEINKQEGKNQ